MMNANSRFLLRSFRKYYKSNPIVVPSRFGRREFGFMFFDKNFVRRHMRFSSLDEINKFVYAQVPSHCYYSTAYYRKPDAPIIGDKEWMGADLIFDLDADHLAGAENMSYPEMLAQVKKETINLIDSFLLDDLGFDENQINIVFSGGRGYHVHIDSRDIIGLDSHGRREIVDYITSNGLNINWMFPFTRGGEFVPIEDSGGWKFHVRNAMKSLVKDICSLEPEGIRSLYPSIKEVSRELITEYSIDVQRSKAQLFDGGVAVLEKGTREFLMHIVTQDIIPRLSGKIDEPVTADIRRLIRLPGSVHGKSGLRVMSLSRAELVDFDPLVLAVPGQYSDEDVTISTRRDIDIEIKGQRFKLSGIVSVPEYAAVFFVGRGMANIESLPKQ